MQQTQDAKVHPLGQTRGRALAGAGPPGSLDGVDVEFYGPFAHLPGRYEWCRLHTATHGSFDSFIVLGASTRDPATVYVASAAGQAFMRERFAACTTIRVPPDALRIRQSYDGRTVTGRLQVAIAAATPHGGGTPPAGGTPNRLGAAPAERGAAEASTPDAAAGAPASGAAAAPVRRAEMELVATGQPRPVVYGHGRVVWGGPYTCWGVDLEMEARVHGFVERVDGSRESFDGEAGVVTAGSIGYLRQVDAS
jgi:hypothetical protein